MIAGLDIYGKRKKGNVENGTIRKSDFKVDNLRICECLKNLP